LIDAVNRILIVVFVAFYPKTGFPFQGQTPSNIGRDDYIAFDSPVILC